MRAGYFRVATAIAAMYYSLTNWQLTAVLYAVSQGLDAVDGIVARHFNQCTKFGQVLDMLTDRCDSCPRNLISRCDAPHTLAECSVSGNLCHLVSGPLLKSLVLVCVCVIVCPVHPLAWRSASTLGLLCVLSKLYPDWWLSFAALIALDIVSHWFQTYAKMMEGKTTHKGSDNPLLNFYYSFPYLLICCVGNEGFFIALYVLHFTCVCARWRFYALVGLQYSLISDDYFQI